MERKGSNVLGDVELAYLRKDAKRLALRWDNGWPRPTSKVETMTEVQMLPTFGGYNYWSSIVGESTMSYKIEVLYWKDLPNVECLSVQSQTRFPQHDWV